MKTKSALLLLGSLAILFSCQKADPGKEIGALQLSKQFPQPGDSLTLSYQLGEMDGESEIEAFYHYFVGTKTYPEDLIFSHSEGILKAGLSIPDSATAVVFNFSKNGKVDNNGKKGYFLPLYNGTGEVLPGSRANASYFYNNMSYQYEVQNDSALAIMEEDLRLYPHLEEEWDGLYSKMLHTSDKKKGEEYIDKRIRLYSDKENLSDEEFIKLTGFFKTIKNKSAADSVQEIGRQKFPSGRLADTYYADKFYAEKDAEKQEEIFNEFRKMNNGNGTGPGFNYMASNLASKYAANKNWEKFDYYSRLISNNQNLAYSLNNTAWSLAEKGEDLEIAQELSEKSLELLSQIEKPEYNTPKQQEKSLQFGQQMLLDTYALILFKRGHLEKAIENQEKAVAEGKNSEYNERYLQYLIANKEFEKAEVKGANFISTNKATAETKEYYKEAYKKTNRSTEDLDQRMAELHQAGYEKALEDTRKKMLDEEAPQFQLADLNGNMVSLEKLSGKTVILDFWATWCGPCISSFPGMQMAVNKFEEDDTVQIFFVNTFENGPNLKKQVSEFLEENNYSFHVLMDEQQNESTRYKTASAYNVSGIPTKVIIGPDGKLRFKTMGYSGNNDQMLQELEIMIDLLKLPAEAPAKKEPVASL